MRRLGSPGRRPTSTLLTRAIVAVLLAAAALLVSVLLAQAALADAEHAFHRQHAELQAKYRNANLRSSDVAYCWWTVFDGLTRRYTWEGLSGEAEFTRFMSAKVLEPAYNFRDVEPRGIRVNILPAALFLGAYVICTLWFGFSLVYIFDGLGITAPPNPSRREV